MKAVLLLWIFYVFSVLCLLCLCARLFICAWWSPAGKGLTSWLLFVVSNCKVVTFPLVSWLRCGTWLYWFLIFAHLLTLWCPFSALFLLKLISLYLKKKWDQQTAILASKESDCSYNWTGSNIEMVYSEEQNLAFRNSFTLTLSGNSVLYLQEYLEGNWIFQLIWAQGAQGELLWSQWCHPYCDVHHALSEIASKTSKLLAGL